MMVEIESYIEFYLRSLKIIKTTKDPLITNLMHLEFHINHLLKEYLLILFRIDNRQIIFKSATKAMEKIQGNNNLFLETFQIMDLNHLNFPIRDDTHNDLNLIKCNFTHSNVQYSICIYSELKDLQADSIPFLKMYLLLYSSCWQSSINHLATPNNLEMYRSYLEQLSDRQKIILDYVNQNLSNTDISHKLNFSVSTIRNEISYIYRTLQVRNRKELNYIINQFSI
jgi:DNA-binding CsgD family transcriptional regulator